MKLGLRLGLSNQKINIGGFDADTQAVFNEAIIQGYTQPSDNVKEYLNTLIVALKAAGIWNKLDIFYVLATDGDRDLAKINIKNPGTFDCTEVGTVTFTSLQGFNSDGSTGYLNTSFVPSSDGVNYQVTDASLFGYSYAAPDTTTPGIFIGQQNGSFFSHLQLGASSIDRAFTRMNHSGASSVSQNDATRVGFYHSLRNGNDVKIYKNGVQFGSTTTVGDQGLPTGDFHILSFNNIGTPIISNTNFKCSIIGIGSNLESKSSELYSAISTYMSSL